MYSMVAYMEGHHLPVDFSDESDLLPFKQRGSSSLAKHLTKAENNRKQRGEEEEEEEEEEEHDSRCTSSTPAVAPSSTSAVAPPPHPL
jgi:hypothetical protein